MGWNFFLSSLYDSISDRIQSRKNHNSKTYLISLLLLLGFYKNVIIKDINYCFNYTMNIWVERINLSFYIKFYSSIQCNHLLMYYNLEFLHRPILKVNDYHKTWNSDVKFLNIIFTVFFYFYLNLFCLIFIS